MIIRVGIAGTWFALIALTLSAQPGPKKDPVKDPKDAKDVKKEQKPAPILLRTECDRPTATYKDDEPATFLLASSVGGEVEYTFSDDGLKKVSDGRIRIAPNQTYKLDGKLGHPGFLQLRLVQNFAGQTATATAIAAIAPTKIEPTAKAPANFDKFWEAQRAALDKIRIDTVIEFWATESTPTVNVYRVNLANVDDRRVYGWVCVPKGGGPFPAILTLPHAGVYKMSPDVATAELGAVTMNISIHNHAVDNPPGFYKELADGELKDYVRTGWDDPEKSYFRPAILAGVRAIDYLSKRKEVNPKQIAVTGISQGGGLTLCVAGLDDRVGFLAADVPGLCDLNARSHGRIDGWPHWVANAPDKLKKQVEETAEYFDAVNFARKFKGKSLLGVGFMDTVCPPGTVYAAYNVLPEPKTMIDSPKLGHTPDPRWLKAREEFWKANLALKPPPPPKVKDKK